MRRRSLNTQFFIPGTCVRTTTTSLSRKYVLQVITELISLRRLKVNKEEIK